MCSIDLTPANQLVWSSTRWEQKGRKQSSLLPNQEAHRKMSDEYNNYSGSYCWNLFWYRRDNMLICWCDMRLLKNQIFMIWCIISPRIMEDFEDVNHCKDGSFPKCFTKKKHSGNWLWMQTANLNMLLSTYSDSNQAHHCSTKVMRIQYEENNY